jgi:hypothetical protein
MDFVSSSLDAVREVSLGGDFVRVSVGLVG